MHDIEMHEASKEFTKCWQEASRHLRFKMQGADRNWLKADLRPPFLEHLSFRLGNQLFYVRIDDIDGQVRGPGNRNGFRTIADGCKGHACIMQMSKVGEDWKVDEIGWGLIDPDTGKAIDPTALITDEKIEMTDWELHDFAVQTVRDHIEQKLGYQLMSSQGNPGVDPSIWFVGNQGPEWVVVREVRYPDLEAMMPSSIEEVAEGCAHLSRTGHFASVSCANSEDVFDSSGRIPALPLWRGHGIIVKFQGLISTKIQ